MHNRLEEGVVFECDRCRDILSIESGMKNSRKIFRGANNEDPKRRRCENCSKMISKTSIARHRATSRRSEGGEVAQQELQARVYRSRAKECIFCSSNVPAYNFVRHKS